MYAEIVEFAALTGRQRGAWSDLAGRACVPNPFSEPDFVEAAVRGLGERRVGLLTVTDQGSWQAAMPVLRVRRWRRVRGPLLVGWRHQYCYLTTPLLDRTDPQAVMATLLARGADEPGVLGMMLDWVDRSGPVGAVLQGGIPGVRKPLRIEAFARASLERRADNNYLMHAASARHLKEMRRMRRRLEEKVGKLEVRNRAGDSKAVVTFLDLERSGWKGRAGTAMACRADDSRFFAELCQRYSAAQRLQLLALENDGTTVAMKCNLISGEGIFCFKIAFDERLKTFSPGIQLEVANVDVFHGSSSAAWMDSCAVTDNAMINRLWADRRELQSVLVCPGGMRGALGSGIWRSARSVRSVRSAIAASRRKASRDDAS
ncbi:MAG: GNAT family N-acetyltransferase [Solirubrobacteraceae bacterium]